MRNFWQLWQSFISKLRWRKRRAVKIVLGKKDLREIGQAISQPVTKAVAGLQAAHHKALLRLLLAELKKELPKAFGVRPPREPSVIKMKEPFINPIESGAEFRPHFSRKPLSQKTSGANVAESLTALKKSQMKFKKLRGE